ncbi:MAG: hypothetical protein H6730_22615 [Deltaproteobacteria bacterium]|nr:hypothetical protein [Deltaproteobacteria bacterium]
MLNARSSSLTLALLLALTACSGGGRERTPVQPRPATDGGVSAGTDAGVVVNTPCTTSSECGAGVCDRSQGRCAECRTSDDCGAGGQCAAGRCAATADCASDLTCTPMGQVCDQAGGKCVACNSAADCPGGPCLGHTCLDNPACTSSLECADLHMVCAQALPPAWPESYGGQGCAECAGANDCGPREACHGGLCQDVCAGRVCGSVEGATCGTCPGESFCTPDGRGCLAYLATSFSAEEGFAQGATALVWADGRSGAAALWSVDLATGTDRLLTLGVGAEGYLDGATLAGGKVFAAYTDGYLYSGDVQGRLSRFTAVPGLGTSNSVWCQGLAGHDAYVICALVDYDDAVPSGLYRFPLDGQPGVKIDDVVQPSGLIVADEEVFWSDFNGGVVGKTGLLSGQHTVLERVQADLLAVEGGYVYYVDTDDALRRVPAAGGASQGLTTEPNRWWLLGHGPEGLILGDRQSGGALYEADLDGSNLRVLVDFGEAVPIDAQSLLAVQRVGNDLVFLTRYGAARLTR